MPSKPTRGRRTCICGNKDLMHYPVAGVYFCPRKRCRVGFYPSGSKATQRKFLSEDEMRTLLGLTSRRG